MNLTEEQKFAIHWCFNYAMKYVDKYNPIINPYSDNTITVNGVNINETIKNLLGDRLFV